MKKQLFAVVVGAALAFPLFAQAEGAYVGVNVGRSELKASDEFDSIKKSDTGYKAYAGYDFTQNFGAEAGYVDFGKLTEKFDGGKMEVKSHAFYVAATGTLPLNEQFSLFAKAGVSQNRTKATVSELNFSESVSKNKTSALFGIGAAYNINKNLSAVAEYENFGKVANEDGSKVKADLLSIGLRYKF
ncbi:outer membrane protein A precursor [Janthinobacterium sp. HH103]|uniref:Autotransporter outer membrane beta-barrel domain-containing protein n=1 Tax=Janthinobacterium agaricidamnosum TaxID=55508 RepID=A0A3G2EDZ4_9BURK|nr:MULTISPECIES: outer membrane beta-barrel protein [Janthinobacterium]AYM77699.1 autotransporter outer membrane beta-barrel domain-containing protein [Janthinobacterium agaricidamnosum]MCC7682938.1 outer membrane beta-barrel protein [Janthinobacterium sp. FW305-128]OEZ64678.1 outer membrane protein A precursor [Janthinobacterium sp. HH100]OEZ84062.1 outer membrane protein A precursor [Janthinobacterium sp. HH103]OEZ87621.1 outer membrane protein A precursor [Janthinobacterium sp. HH106]